MFMKKMFAGILAALVCNALWAQHKIEVDASKKTAEISPYLWGLFIEDVNMAADGGLYGELIKNRSFDFPHPWVGWTPFGDVSLEKEKPAFERNPNYARMSWAGGLRNPSLENGGFREMGFKGGEEYRLSFYARTPNGNPVKLKGIIVNSKGRDMAAAEVEVSGNEWKKYEISIASPYDDTRGKFRLELAAHGTVDVDHISLFPKNTFKNRENGLRKDVAEAIAALKPRFFRFPGGCIIEGNTLDERFNWKNSVGPVENRPIAYNIWSYNFGEARASDYFQSYGLGFYEYFQFCEDIGASPVPVVNAGLPCQFKGNPPVPMDELQPYIQDALDLIEFANGPKTSKWGKVRADMGHPKPFNMKMIGIGNEQWGEVFIERLAAFQKAINEKYPDIVVIGSSGPGSDGADFDMLWAAQSGMKIPVIDEHYYRDQHWFYNNMRRYDGYDRNGPRVFIGEYACHTGGKAYEAALAEASYLTSVERNADVVYMTSYAPLLAQERGFQWAPNMIHFDNNVVARSPSYWVQHMFSNNAGTHAVEMTSPDMDLRGEGTRLYGSAVVDENKKELIIKISNAEFRDVPVEFDFKGAKISGDTADVTYLHSLDLTAGNTVENPDAVVPQHEKIKLDGGTLKMDIRQFGFYVIKLKLK